MKTRELIRILQDEDPSGELECCVGNSDIHFVGEEPGYYDGCHTVLVRDPTKQGYDVVAVEIRAQTNKIVIHALGWRGAIANVPDVPITFDSDYARERFTDDVEARRAEVRSWDIPRHRKEQAHG